jgi:hypothetical protein
MGENIFIGDLEKEITSIDGVISIIDFSIYSIYGGSYNDKCPLPGGKEESADGDAHTFKIDLDAIDGVLYSDYNSMFEILNPNIDIKCKVKLM